MSKFKLYFILFGFALTLFSCNKSDDTYVVPIRDSAAQSLTDDATIQDFLKHHYLHVVNSDSYDDQDVTMPDLPTDNSQIAMWDLPGAGSVYPQLLSKSVTISDVNYTIYYIKLREGDQVNGKSPSRVDLVLASYNGSYLNYTSETTDTTTVTTLNNTVFEYVPFPSKTFDLSQTIRGWSEIFPEFYSGSLLSSASEGNPALYANFGAGVMFVPSGLGYFNYAQTSSSNVLIPSYSPLIFSFKLYNVIRSDQDGDGILSNDEDLNHDGDFTNDDTDGDGYQNYLDADDDNDGYYTKAETKRPNVIINGVSTPNGYYPYNGALIDDPSTPYIDERQGVPRKFTGPIDSATNLNTPLPEDYTDPGRLRNYLDPTTH